MEHQVMSNSAIEHLYETYHGPILRHLEQIVRQRETAEDLCHETFIKALRHWNGLENEAAARGWLYRIATNTAYDYLRRQRLITMTPLNETYVASDSQSAFEARHEDAESVWATLDRMPDHYRVALLLHSWAGYSLNDMAVALESNVTTIKMRVHRARERFRDSYHASL